MTRALVLMKAMPPTKGHAALIEFASYFSTNTTVLVDMASNEPMREERILAIISMCSKLASVKPQFITMEPQTEDDADDFWEQWAAHLEPYHGYDYVIGSEDYCFAVAEMIGARYIPYDPNRELVQIKATTVRQYPEVVFNAMANEFQPFIRPTITVFGAESTGKTTLSKALSRSLNAHWLFEWARPYLETVGPEINVRSMEDIWLGQYSVEEMTYNKTGKPFIVRDTDLYSTVGYWEQPHWADALGPVPEELIYDAKSHKADLYIITKSNIPFEEDPLRYGGDKRESPDEYWIKIAKKYGLNYVVLDSAEHSARLREAEVAARKFFNKKVEPLMFDRRGA